MLGGNVFSSKSRQCFFPSCLSHIAVALLNIQMAVIRGLPLMCSMQVCWLVKELAGAWREAKGGNLFKFFSPRQISSLQFIGALFWWQKKKEKACKTPVDSSYENDSYQSSCVPVIMTWPVHKLLPLLRGFIPVSILYLLSLMTAMRKSSSRRSSLLPGNVPMGPLICV